MSVEFTGGPLEASAMPLESCIAAFLRLRIASHEQLIGDFAVSQIICAIRIRLATDATAADALWKLTVQAALVPRDVPCVRFFLTIIMMGETEDPDFASTAEQSGDAARIALCPALQRVFRSADRRAQLGACIILLEISETINVSDAFSQKVVMCEGGIFTQLLETMDVLSSCSASIVLGERSGEADPPGWSRLAVTSTVAVLQLYGALARRVLTLDLASSGNGSPVASVRDFAPQHEALWGSVSVWRCAAERLVDMHNQTAEKLQLRGLLGPELTAGREAALLRAGWKHAAQALDVLCRRKDAADLQDYRTGNHRSGLHGLANTVIWCHAAASWSDALCWIVHSSSSSRAGMSFRPGNLLGDMIRGWAELLVTPDAPAPSDRAVLSSVIVLCRDALRLGLCGGVQTLALWQSHPDLARAASDVLLMRGMHYTTSADGAGDPLPAAINGPAVVGLSAALLGSITPPVNHTTASSLVLAPVGTVDSIIGLLCVKDVAAQCTVQIVAQAALHRPHLILPRLFELLNSEQSASRSNAVSVIDALTLSGHELDAPVAHRLCDCLIARLEDEQLGDRVDIASLLGRLPPDTVLPRLVDAAGPRDAMAKRRGTALAAVVRLLKAQTTTEQLVAALRTFASLCAPGELLVKAPQRANQYCAAVTPADLVTIAQTFSHNVSAPKSEEPLTHLDTFFEAVLTKWAPSSEGEVEAVVRAACMPPTLPILLRSLRCCHSLVNHADMALRLLSSVIRPLEGISETASVLDAIAPWLVLRSLPSECFGAASTPIIVQLVDAVSTETFALVSKGDARAGQQHQQQQDDIGKLVLECFGRLPPLQTVPHLTSWIGSEPLCKEVDGASHPGVRRVLFVLCTALSSHSNGDSTRPVSGSVVLCRALRDLISALATRHRCVTLLFEQPSRPPPDFDLKLAQALWDTAAMVELYWAASGFAMQPSSISEHPLSPLYRDWSDACDMPPPRVAAICRMCAILKKESATMSAVLRQSLGCLVVSGIRYANAEARLNNNAHAARLAALVFHLVVAGAALDTAVTASSQQTFEFALGCASFAGSMSCREEIRQEGVKLIGALLVDADADRLAQIGEHRMAKALRALQSAAAIGTDRQVRLLAENLLNSLSLPGLSL